MCSIIERECEGSKQWLKTSGRISKLYKTHHFSALSLSLDVIPGTGNGGEGMLALALRKWLREG